METSSGNKVTAVNHKIDYDKTMETARKQFFCCARKTHDPESCEEGCQFVIREQLKRNNGQWPPTKYPKGTFLSLPRNVEPPLTCYYGPCTLKSLASQTSPYYRNSVITESSAWSDSDDESYYYELPKWLVGRNPKHEVPRDFMKGTTACKEATEGHSPLWWLAPAKVIEAGKSAEDLSEEIFKEHESLDCDVDSERESITAARLGELGSSKMRSSSKRDDYSDEDELDAKEMKKLESLPELTDHRNSCLVRLHKLMKATTMKCPTRVAGPNPNYEVPSDFMKGTTATEGHLQKAQKYGLTTAKVVEAGNSAEDLSEEICKENESSDCDVDSERERESIIASPLGKIGSRPSSKSNNYSETSITFITSITY
ncbi:hypothetical protein MKX03_031039 [Papaver bracteatum]|nr:hypothetical protein MKX03_031039 [Papaver bracteatum]